MVVVVAVVAMVVAASDGSESDTASGSSPSLLGPEGTLTVPASQNPLPADQLWNPSQLPDSVFSEMQFARRVTERCDFLAGVRSCDWGTVPTAPAGYGGYVYSTRYSLDEVRRMPNFTDFSDTVVDGRRAVKYTPVGKGFVERCDIAWGTSFGSIWVTIARSSSVSGAIDNCGLVEKWARLVYRNAPK
ncbi:hypothetical protein GS4_23_01430 [Gordonia soli NBRC 108243]|uniref:DUF3558 domain-containing protein n=1 Tax=Gordonia soli NBRC 108243 TaxID=1223545 RepID=M0QM40_9ACTN|nr:hypothetical protein GS4_23_01430 [Gordonia soli NBRC 108243]